MSRILIFDLENKLAGEVHGNATRGWAISNGMDVSLTLSRDAALKPCLELGRMIYIDGGVNADGSKKLPNWAGMIDTPWSGIAPVKVTAYDIPYLMAISMPWGNDSRSGNSGLLGMRFVELANQPGDLFLREGEVESDGIERVMKVVNTKTNWAQLAEHAAAYGLEMQFRPEMSADNRLEIYVDIKKRLGQATQVILQDGEGGNMTVLEASVLGEIVNAAKGYNDASTETGKLYTDVLLDQESIDRYRIRNRLMQFKTASATDLETNVKSFLGANSKPYLQMKVAINDANGIFSYLRNGNELQMRATQIVLPGGRAGWSGMVRISAMQYDEGANQVTMTVLGSL